MEPKDAADKEPVHYRLFEAYYEPFPRLPEIISSPLHHYIHALAIIFSAEGHISTEQEGGHHGEVAPGRQEEDRGLHDILQASMRYMIVESVPEICRQY